MIEIDEALRLVLARVPAVKTQRRSTIDAVGYALAEAIVADVDSPPHDKSLVDGYAIRVEDAGEPLRVVEQVVAGAVPARRIEPGTASQVMTGAPIPEGAEAMVMVEQSERSGDVVRLTGAVESGQFIMPRATTFARGEMVLPVGTRIRAIEVGLLSEVGRAEVVCANRPTVAVLPTGDELVAADEQPGAGQIRNSNGPMLEARVTAAGCEARSLGVGRDDEDELRRQIEQGLQSDILILSGGVSAGVRDLVPPTLQSLGVEEVFHKVRLKPGKPLWFGVRERDGRRTLVFGLPGNPVSSFVCFELFVLPAIRAISGLSPNNELIPMRLAESFRQRGNRPTYHPGSSWREQGRLFVKPLSWRGSADMLTVSRADCLIYFPPGERTFEAGSKLESLPLQY